MESSIDFRNEFYNLQGATLGDKRKNFFILLNNFKSLEQSVKNDIVTSIIPTNYLQKIFKIEALIYFRISEQLYQMLATEIDESTRRIFRQKWLFQKPFELISVSKFVDELLPNFSIVNRYKFLSRLGRYHKDEEKMDQLFDSLLQKYGLVAAKLLLPACSAPKIEAVVDNYEVRLSRRQLSPVYNKSRTLFMSLVKKYTPHLSFQEIRSLREYLASIDIIYCFETCKKQHISLGKRSTQKLLSSFKSEILQNPDYYLDNLHSKSVGKFLTTEELRLALINLYPKKYSDFRYYSITGILRFFSRDEQLKVYSETYKEVYDRELTDHTYHLDEDMVERIRDTEEREKWIEYKLKEGVTDTRYIHCYELSKALKMIKSKISFTSTYKVREILVEKLVDACKFYNDKDAVLEVLQYICKRHRNDDIITAFASYLSYNFDLSEMSQEHWKYIHEILEIIKVKGHFFNSDTSIEIKYIEFLWKNKKPINECVAKCIAKDDSCAGLYYIKKLQDKSLEKAILIIYLETNPKISKDEDQLLKKDIKVINWVLEWNNQNKNDTIDILNYPRLISSLKTFFNKDCITSLDMFKTYICTRNQSALGKYLTEVFFRKSSKNYNQTYRAIIIWFLKNYPEAIVPYTKEFIKSIYKKPYHDKSRYGSRRPPVNVKNSHNIILNHVKKLDNYPFRQEAISFGLEHYEKEDADVSTILRFVAFLMEPQDYVNTISKHVPLPERMDLDEDEKCLNFVIEKAVIRSFTQARSTVVLTSAVKFCHDEYLKDALNTLYYYIFHMPENIAKQFMNEQSTHSVLGSIQSFSLACKFSSTETVVSMYQSLSSSGDVAIQKKSLRKVLKYLKKNPADKLFEIILIQLKDLKQSDKRTLKILKKIEHLSSHQKVRVLDFILNNVNCQSDESLLSELAEIFLNKIGDKINDMPLEYKIKFLSFVVSHFKAHTESTCSLKKVINEFLSKIDDIYFIDVPYDLCNLFIENFFLKEVNLLSVDNVRSFIIHYVFNSSHDFSKKCDVIFKIVNAYQEKSAQNFLTKIQSKREFVLLIFIMIKNIITKSPDIIQAFYDKLLETYQYTEYFEIFYFLRILLIQKESSDIRIESEKLHSLLMEIHSIAGPVVPLFVYTVQKAYEESDTCDKLHSLCQSLYEIDKSAVNCAFILSLLPCSKPDNMNERQKYNVLINSLGAHVDPLVKIQFSIFIRSTYSD